MNIVDIIGSFAVFMAAIIFLPQVIKTVKTKETKGLSLSSFILISVSNSLWLTYGLLSADKVIVLSQVFLFPMGLIILIYKIKYG
ncbi:hypothetical protein MNBD_IGNAVI01-1946 [hydrothermal vent metagenome]|uniref:PQ loop repeat n=1 Tax=hydrothermal vent metagenome TaxID=652676 RepID=A0A3B1BQB4_9ZZZZ